MLLNKWNTVFLLFGAAGLLAVWGEPCRAGVESAVAGESGSQDWPMWRYDAGRSASVSQELADSLHLQWVRRLPPPRRAWPEQHDDGDKLAFDRVYEPVAAEGRLFVPSMVTDRVTAYDLATGEFQWDFATGGPVRLAPAYSQGRLYVASDDGYLVCLAASTGEQIWRFRAAPGERMVLGNERLISMWPVRGGPVVHEGIVYLAAGIWPFEGVYVYALDAETAEVIWEHSGVGEYAVDAYGGDARSFSTLAPQGYLAVAGDRLIVAGGRSTPAVFDRHSGQLLRFHPVDKRRGGYGVFAPEGYDGTNPRNFLLPLDRCVIRTGDQTHDSRRWSERVEGRVARLLAADQRLIAVTEQGHIHVFGPEAREPIEYEQDTVPLPPAEDLWTERVAELLEESEAGSGYALLFGIGTGRLLDELLRQSELHVVAFDPDAARVARFRRRYVDAGLYGKRVAVRQGDARTVAAPPYIASLIVAEDGEAAGLQGDPLDIASFLAALRPYGGIAWLPLGNAVQDAWSAAVQEADLAGFQVRPVGDSLRVERPGPLPGAGAWTHQYADAANSGYSPDDRVRGPLGVAWFGGPSNDKTLPRHMNGPVPQVVAGRLILLGVDYLSARCAFTGRELWANELTGVGEAFTCRAHEERYERGLPVYFPSYQGASFRGSPYVSTVDSVYVLHQNRCLRLDLESGQIKDAFVLPDREQLARLAGAPADSYASQIGETERQRWGHISVSGDALVVTAYPHTFESAPSIGSLVTPRASSAGRAHIRYSMPGQDRLWHWNETSSEFLLAMDRHTGEIRWVRQARYGFRHNAVATGGGQTFAIDHVSETIRGAIARRGLEPDMAARIFALDLETGQQRWSRDEPVFGTWLAYSKKHDVLIQSGRPGGRSVLPDEPNRGIVALRGADGSVLWQREEGFRQGPLALHEAQDRILPVSLDILTGQPVGRENPLTGQQEPWSFAINKSCGTQNVSQHLLTFRSSMASYHDLQQDSGTADLSGVRAGCTNNMIVADGVLNVPDYTRSCSCAYQLQTSFGLVPRRDVEVWTISTSADPPPGTIRRVGINFGAPGVRMDDGLMWINYPEREHVSAPGVPVRVETVEDRPPGWFRWHSLRVTAGDGGLPWVAASGVEGVRRVELDGLFHNGAAEDGSRYTVRLHFAEPEPLEPGERVFDVRIQGETVIRELDLVQAAGGSDRAYVAEFAGVALDPGRPLVIEFVPGDGSAQAPLLCGLETRLEE